MSKTLGETLSETLRKLADQTTGDILRAMQGESGMHVARLFGLGVALGLISQAIDDAPANADRSPAEQVWNRCAKPVEEAGEVVDALIGVFGSNPRKGPYATLDHVREELLDTALSALAAWEHLDGNHGRVMEEFATFVYERRLNRLINPETGRIHPEFTQDLVGPDYQWDDRARRLREPRPEPKRGAVFMASMEINEMTGRIPPLPESAPFPWARHTESFREATREFADAVREESPAMAETIEVVADVLDSPLPLTPDPGPAGTEGPK